MAKLDPYLTLVEAVRLVSMGEVSPADLVELYLERIAALDGKLNSFITVTADSARRQAQQMLAAVGEGGAWPPLSGAPLGIKDLFDVRGLATTGGSAFFKERVAAEDAAAVAALRSAGAIFLGKLNLHEIALGLTNVNPHFGACHNPWDLERVSGGSSGGSAVATAAGLCLGALGSDTGGSIRVPAALCGVVGLKPTYRRISLRGALPLSWNIDHAGPLGRCVKDVARLYQVLAGYDPLDPGSFDWPVEGLGGLEGSLAGMRVASAEGEYLTEMTDLEVWEAVQAAALVLRDLGASVRPVDMSWLREAARANGLIVQADAAAFHRERMQTSPEKFGDDVRQRLEMGAATNLQDYILARRTQTTLRRRLELFFGEVDALIMPTCAIPAPLIAGPSALEQARMLTRFTAPFNLTGLPAITVPCGFTQSGLPIGLQIVTPPWQEGRALRIAQAYEQATPWHRERPFL
jgi:aspartyl-tRNA(Asn)/glutamyl-tRNA(Gln) amidotransferase subunit A